MLFMSIPIMTKIKRQKGINIQILIKYFCLPAKPLPADCCPLISRSRGFAVHKGLTAACKAAVSDCCFAISFTGSFDRFL